MARLFIGLMSGTSLDGIDGVLFDAEALAVTGHVHAPFPAALRDELLALNSPGDNELHRAALAARLARDEGSSPFTGSSPGGASRWSRGRSSEWVPLRGDLVAEVAYDQVTGGRFRHGTTFQRWRSDKRPDQCTRDQLEHELSPAALEQVFESAGA